VCAEATTHSDLTWIQTNVFTPSCVFTTGCHNGSDTTGTAAKIDLRPGQARAHLVNATSHLEPTRKLVVPGNPAKSYMLVMLGHIQPQNADPPAPPIRSDVGTMPQGTAGQLLCAGKREVIQRWILNDAPNN
jgi:hypothetical protein